MYLKRNFVLLIFFFISILLWHAWQKRDLYSNFNTVTVKQYSGIKSVNREFNKSDSKIFIETDVLKITINLYGGDIEKAELLSFKDKLKSSKSFVLLDTKKNFMYQMQSGLIGTNGLDNLHSHIRPIYKSYNTYYKLVKNQKEIHVPIKWISYDGVIYKKIFILKSGRYDILVKYEINNLTDKKLAISMFGQLKQTINFFENNHTYKNNFVLQTFRGAAYSTDNDKYVKYSFDSISKNKKLNLVATYNGWIAMLQQYFVAAWIPDNHYLNTIYVNGSTKNIAEIGYYSDYINVFPHSKATFGAKLWIGPEIQDKMANVASYLDLTVDYGWLWFLSQPLFKLLKFLYNIVGNWGASIMLITFIIKGLTFPLTKSQFETMSKIRNLQPTINAIKEQYKNNKQKMSEEIMLLYKRENINPLGGCFPLLIQMPIFLALYYMLVSSVELRHAPFIFWINDLSGQDPYYVLPILMGLTMFFIQRITPNNITDPIQKKIMNYIPIIFTIFFLWFPSGLVLYYIVSNLVTIIQQKFIINNLNKISKEN